MLLCISARRGCNSSQPPPHAYAPPCRDRRLALRTQRTRSGYAPSLRAPLPQPSEEWEATPRDTPTPYGSRSGSAALDAPASGGGAGTMGLGGRGDVPRSGSASGGLASVPEV